MFSLAHLFALSLALQADGPVAPVAAPPPADPIGDLVARSANEALPPPPPPPPVPPSAPPPVAAPAASPPAAPIFGEPPLFGAARPASPPTQPYDDEDKEDPTAGLPAGPLPYTSLPPSTPARPDARMFTQPLVRLPPRPTGALDGGWVLSSRDGRKLFGFQFNDAGGAAEVEGAWRDLRREWGTLGSGTVTSVGYDGMDLTIRFYEKGRSGLSEIALRRAGGEWAGEMRGEGRPTAVVMRRD